MSFLLQPTRNAGLDRLQSFLPYAGVAYARTRNSDLGPAERSNVSVLSGHLRHRLICETEVLEAVTGKFALSTSEKFIQEVFWRGYFKGWLEQRPSVWTTYRSDVDQLTDRLVADTSLADAYHKAVSGGTGIACFDAWVRELVETGYLHNHTRMWFASIWIFTLKLPWQLGADFFYRHLVDGDPASNTLSWRWVGGLHTRGKTYLARPDNIEKYTDGRFAPHGQLATVAVPLEDETTHPRVTLRTGSTPPTSEPVVVLITEEDCYLEDVVKEVNAVGGLALLATDTRSPLAGGTVARDFAMGALQDASARAERAFGCSFSSPREADDWGTVLETVCKEFGVRHVVTSFAPVGPVAEKLTRARGHLAEQGFDLIEVQRRYDTLTWPHAGRGFFALKKKIPDILEDLQREMVPQLF